MSSDLKSSVEAAAAPSASTIGDQKLADFYAQHNVSLDRVLDGSKKSCFPHRFIRLNPRFDAKETLRLLKVCLLLIQKKEARVAYLFRLKE